MLKFLKRKKRHWFKHYKTSKWPVIVDISLIFIVLSLFTVFLSLYFFYPEKLNIIQINENNNQEENSYQIDINNLPLEIISEFEESILDRNNAITKLNIELINNSEIEINDIKLIINEENIEVDKLAAYEKREESIDLKFDSDANNIKPSINIEYEILNQKIKDTHKLNEINFKANLDLQAIALYTSSDGENLGLGPLPPVLGLPTNYWLFFDLDLKGEANEFILSAKLPKNVNYYDEYTLLSGELNYIENNRQLIWKIDNLDSDSDDYHLGVEVQLIPEIDQVGELGTLLTDIVYYANDSLSGEEISGTASNIDTSLEFDKFNFEGIISEK